MPATKAARNRMSGLRRFLSPLKATLRAVHPPPSPPLSGVSGCGISELLKVLPKPAYHISQTNALIVARVLQRKISQGLNLSGKKVPVGNFLGLSISTWLIAQQATVIYAVDTNYEGMEETSGVLKDDLRSLWSLARKFQLPAVLFVTVLLGWRHPFVLFINVALLLFCTRPSPLSIYVFIEQIAVVLLTISSCYLDQRFIGLGIYMFNEVAAKRYASRSKPTEDKVFVCEEC